VIEFRVLGAVEAVRDGSTLALGGPRQRALLALLLLEPGQPVSGDRLVEELWYGNPPAGASTTLRSYVSRLRRVLGPEVPIVGHASGYALEVPPELIDRNRFERLARGGAEALGRRTPRRAAERFREALSLWGGRPFAELSDEGALRAEADRLEDLRLNVVEQRIEAELELGESSELVEELEALVREHRLREPYWRQLMLALYRAGRQADALDTYRRARNVLREEVGLEPSEELKRLEQAILRQEVERVQPPEERHNLPAPTTSFLGRETELAEVAGFLREARLVTLTGLGGAGKTRLALELARRALPDFRDGVFLCDFAPLREPELVTRRVSSVLGVQEQAGVETQALLVRQLRRSELLLVLDNCEHLLETSAELAQRLLAGCERVRILATSRASLGLPGEVDYSVPPLSLPPPEASLAELQRSEAVALFLARASEARPKLEQDADSVLTAAKICADLEGLPLAIELAAARVKALTLQDIAERLTDRFRFLTSWRRLTDARHRTLGEAMDWSYELLSKEEQVLLDRLSVFSGTFDLEAVAGVCLEGDEERALELVERLVDASLVGAGPERGATRYRLLETVRQYGAGRLGERGESEAVHRRHLEHYTRFAEDCWWMMPQDRQKWVQELQPDYDNLRAALAWSRDARKDEYLGRLVAVIWQLWWVRGDLTEGREWLDLALERGPHADRVKARILEGAAGLAWAQGDFDRAADYAQTGLNAFEELEEPIGRIGCQTILGHVAMTRRDFREAERRFAHTRELGAQLGAEHRGDLHVALADMNLGSVAHTQGDLDRAADLYRSARAVHNAEGDRGGAALCDLFLGLAAVEAGRFEDAEASLGEAFPVFQEMGFLQYVAHCLDGIAGVAQARGKSEEAARLLGAAEGFRERTGNPAPLEGARERTIAEAKRELGEEAFEAAYEQGRALPESKAMAQAQALVT
jgi:predicted ATPase/DNA-binding SARP family transcriptional activator